MGRGATGRGKLGGGQRGGGDERGRRSEDSQVDMNA